MGISQSAIGILYLYALLSGFFLGAVYDCLRLTRVLLGSHYSRRVARRLRAIRLPFLSKRGERRESRALGIVVFFEDLIFCLFAGILVILLFYQANNGKFRFPVVLCLCAGFLIYRGTLGRVVMLCSEVIAYAIESCLRYTFFFLFFPLRRAKQRIAHLAGLAWGGICSRAQKKSRLRYTKLLRAQIATNACGALRQKDIQLSNKKLKKGKRYAKGKEKAVQSQSDPARFSGSDRGGIHHRVCK